MTEIGAGSKLPEFHSFQDRKSTKYFPHYYSDNGLTSIHLNRRKTVNCIFLPCMQKLKYLSNSF